MFTRRLMSLAAMVAVVVVALFALVGGASAASEASEAANGAEARISQVDLTYNDVEWGGSWGDTVSVTVKNVGSANSAGFYISFAKLYGPYIGKIWVSGLRAGASTTVQLTTMHTCLIMLIDSENKVAEYDEQNNLTITCNHW
jgi:hypothetical protein